MASVGKEWEPVGGRFWGIWNVEGEGEPIVLFARKEDAMRDLERRRALPEEDDDRLTYEPSSRRLTMAQIVEVNS